MFLIRKILTLKPSIQGTPILWEAIHGQLKGEATPIYLFLPDVLKALSVYNQNLKIIVLLRDPVDRAISHYEMARARGEEDLPLWRALLAESTRLVNDNMPLAEGSPTRNQSYRSRGYYSKQLEQLYLHFKSEQVLVLPMRKLLCEHDKTIKTVFSFLGVDSMVSVPQEIIFSHETSKKCYPFSRFILPLLSARIRANARLIDAF